jgi:hypothetical protein
MDVAVSTESSSAKYGADIEREISSKITHILSIYPRLSPTMLQVGIGTGISPSIWHPVLEGLIERGKVDKTQVMSQSPKGREQTYTIISLKAA